MVGVCTCVSHGAGVPCPASAYVSLTLKAPKNRIGLLDVGTLTFGSDAFPGGRGMPVARGLSPAGCQSKKAAPVSEVPQGTVP